jgi:hypothetical protein
VPGYNLFPKKRGDWNGKSVWIPLRKKDRILLPEINEQNFKFDTMNTNPLRIMHTGGRYIVEQQGFDCGR